MSNLTNHKASKMQSSDMTPFCLTPKSIALIPRLYVYFLDYISRLYCRGFFSNSYLTDSSGCAGISRNVLGHGHWEGENSRVWALE